MKKFYYISNTRIPTEKAHGVHMMKMCEALGRREDLDVTFVAPGRINPIKEDPYSYFNVERTFQITYLPVIDIIPVSSWIGYWIGTITFLFSVAVRFLFTSRSNTTTHTRSFLVARVMHMLGFASSYEAHRILAKKDFFFGILKPISRIVTNSEGVADEFRKRGFEHVKALPNAVDTKEFKTNITQQEARKLVGLPLDKTIAVYTGHLYEWKGVDTAVDAAEQFKDADIQFVFVGGTKEDVARYRKRKNERRLTNISFLGHKPKRDIPNYLVSADILLLPNSASTEESIRYTSPMKLFEYMASGVPIVASRLPSIGEILSEDSAVFFKPNNPSSLAGAIERVLRDTDLAQRISAQARRDAEKYTWEQRAEKLLAFISQ